MHDAIYGERHTHTIIMSVLDLFTSWRESKLSADHISITGWPKVRTNCAPLFVETNLNSALSVVLSTTKSDITF